MTKKGSCALSSSSGNRHCSATHRNVQVSDRDTQRAHQRSQVASRDTDNLSEKPTSEEVDETFRDVEVDGNGRIDSSGFRQDALAKIQEVTELGQSFVKNDT